MSDILFPGKIKSFYRRIIKPVLDLFKVRKEAAQTREFLLGLREKYPFNNSRPARVLLIPLMEDPGTMKLAFRIAYKIANDQKLRIKFFYVHTAIDTKISGDKWLAFSFYRKYTYFISLTRLRITYNVRSRDIVMSNYLKSGYQSTGLNNLDSKEALLQLTIDNIIIGDLVYDTYLRFRTKPTVDLSDPDLQNICAYAEGMVKKWGISFRQNPVKCLLLPYASYIHWGIPVRLALERGIEVTTFGSNIYILNRMNKQFPFHTKNYHLYHQIFKRLPAPDSNIEIAKRTIEKRLNGESDTGTNYMKHSAFHNVIEETFAVVDSKPWAVIFLHCFFDSPHIYGNGLFPDFYEWMRFILRIASENPHIDYYFKEHPNGLPGNHEVVRGLIGDYGKFENIKLIPNRVSNKQILQNAPNAAFTFYGTVAHEFAYCGIPVITSVDNPHSNYHFIYNPGSIEEFKYFLTHVGEYKLPEGYSQRDILEFFYMHYKYYSDRYDEGNFNLIKDFDTGNLSLPEDGILNDFTYGNYKESN